MPPRKTLNKLEEKKADNSLNVITNLDSVDEILNNVDDFIQDVYRNLNITSPQSNTSRSLTSIDSSSPLSSSLSMGAVGGTLSPATYERSPSPTTHRNMDAEIEKINRICDNVDQNLRSIGVFINNTGDREKNRKNTVAKCLSATSVADVEPLTTTTMNAPITVAATQVIDLLESQTPQVLRQPNHRNLDESDDDVIIVSADFPVVDLCTPGFEGRLLNRSNIIRSELSRRRLAGSDYDLQETSTNELGPSMARRRRTVSTETSAQIQKNDNPATTSDRTPIMCPVCMDSCLQRNPTSTKCGHVFCEECIKRAIRLTHKCPMCNAKISNTQVFRIYL